MWAQVNELFNKYCPKDGWLAKCLLVNLENVSSGVLMQKPRDQESNSHLQVTVGALDSESVFDYSSCTMSNNCLPAIESNVVSMKVTYGAMKVTYGSMKVAYGSMKVAT